MAFFMGFCRRSSSPRGNYPVRSSARAMWATTKSGCSTSCFHVMRMTSKPRSRSTMSRDRSRSKADRWPRTTRRRMTHGSGSVAVTSAIVCYFWRSPDTPVTASAVGVSRRSHRAPAHPHNRLRRGRGRGRERSVQRQIAGGPPAGSETRPQIAAPSRPRASCPQARGSCGA